MTKETLEITTVAGRKGQRSGGHNAKPTEQHKRDGTYRKCEHENRADNQPAIGQPVKPDDLESVESHVWDEVVTYLDDRCLGRVDSVVLREMCRWYAVYRNCMAALQCDPLDKEARLGCTAAWDRFWKIAQDFGATPVSRARLQIPQQAAETKQRDASAGLYELLESRN